MGISAGPRLIQDALRFARKGVLLNPTNRRARAVLSYVHLLNGQVDEARREAEAALELKPNSLMLICGIGYLLTLSGDWEHGPELSRKAIRLNPFHLSVVHAGLWLDALRRKDFEEALRQAQEFMTPENFWDPLMEAVPLAFLGRHDEAACAIYQLLQLKPDFQERGHWLITRYTKFDELGELIEDGLEKAGLQVNRT